MAAIPYETAYAFLNKRKGFNGAFRSTGDALFTYSRLLAYWKNGEVVLDVPRDWRSSPTSNRHFKALLMALDNPTYVAMMSRKHPAAPSRAGRD